VWATEFIIQPAGTVTSKRSINSPSSDTGKCTVKVMSKVPTGSGTGDTPVSSEPETSAYADVPTVVTDHSTTSISPKKIAGPVIFLSLITTLLLSACPFFPGKIFVKSIFIKKTGTERCPFSTVSDLLLYCY
jgi:hypothetical protein